MIKKLNDSLKKKLFVKADPKTQIDRDLLDLKFDIAFEIKFEIADELVRIMDLLGFSPFFKKRPVKILGDTGSSTNFCLKCMIVHFDLLSGVKNKTNLDKFALYYGLISLVDNFPSKNGKPAYFECQHCETKWEDHPS